MAKRSLKTKRARIDPVAKLAKTLGISPEQARPGTMEITPVVNHSDADQKDSLSLKRTETVRRLTRVELLHNAGIITSAQVAACEWYGDNYQHAFDYGQGTCANYGGVGGRGGLGWDLGSRTIAQSEARKNIAYARLAIPGHLLGIFEKVVIGPLDIRTLTKESRIGFSRAAFHLGEQISHLLVVAA